MEKVVKNQIQSSLEARPIAMLVQVASRYDSTVYLQAGTKKVNAKSIMGMMSLNLKTGDDITVIVEGSDEVEAMKGIEEYLSNTK